MNYRELPVYQEKDRILSALRDNQVIIVQSPTGSGKTTQIPIILHEAGYDSSGVIAVTQPRRIATLSVSGFISEQLALANGSATEMGGLVGYKMRFEDKTGDDTKIKIMTDGILLQEMKLDPMLSKYSVLMVDEAHERSLNIDFVLGLLKRIIAERHEFKVIVSSATLNTQVFSEYFGGAPIVTIDTTTFPVATIYDTPKITASTTTAGAKDELLRKICEIVERAVGDEKDSGAILIFLPGERAIKDCLEILTTSDFASRIHCLPLYARLSKEEQERVFDDCPAGKRKIIISTNIAETSVTIPDVTVVIDSGLAKLSYYNTKTYTTSLVETKVARASCDQRRGRAGRTQPGTCYRLFSRKDYEKRPLYTTEEIYRTDLSDVVLQMADLGISDFYGFDFISNPGQKGIMGAIKTLRMLDALDKDNGLTNTGRLMTKFPVEPRISRIIVEAILHYPGVTEEAIIASSFLSAASPFVLPAGQELQAREAHHTFNDENGDFVSYLKLFKQFAAFFNEFGSYSQREIDEYCTKYYLDSRICMELLNIKTQLQDIVSQMNIPVLSGGPVIDYLTCIAKGMVQFVAVRDGREHYRTLTQDKIYIHPGSCMCRINPTYIVAGEIIETSRTFASSVSPIPKEVITRIAPDYVDYFKAAESAQFSDDRRDRRDKRFDRDRVITGKAPSLQGWSGKTKQINQGNSIVIAGRSFDIVKEKGLKVITFEYAVLKEITDSLTLENIAGLGVSSKIKGRVVYPSGQTILTGESVNAILHISKLLDLKLCGDAKRFHEKTNIASKDATSVLTVAIQNALKVVTTKRKGKECGFLALYSDDTGLFWLKACRNFYVALKESLSTLETLVDKQSLFTTEEQLKINHVYSVMSALLRT